ncbi:hypothetical protein [Ferrimonas marina]|uniref:Uncharacterized protein n=1 Tax=Ferrimonas marina TaxID=299255 RepID=A0A1M5UDU9_9GAMM|nr:hypothetical protein [Ferrimonas marina]SHH61078.1 hypothetical protein SAMN02745129_2518 [Ferrimonas marina]
MRIDDQDVLELAQACHLVAPESDGGSGAGFSRVNAFGQACGGVAVQLFAAGLLDALDQDGNPLLDTEQKRLVADVAEQWGQR